MAATTTLTLGLVLHGVASDPYQSTREATAGPDVVASVCRRELRRADVVDQPADLAGLEALTDAPGVVDHSGPYPVIGGGAWRRPVATADVQAVGRDPAAAVGRPAQADPGQLGSDGGVVVEAGFADALGVGVGDPDHPERPLVPRSSVWRSPPPRRPIRRRPAWLAGRCVLRCPSRRRAGRRRAASGRRSRSRPGLAHRGGCPESRPAARAPWPTSMNLKLADPAEAPGVRRRAPQPSDAGRRRRSCSPGRTSAKSTTELAQRRAQILC